MQHKSRFIVLAIVLSVLALAIGPANAQTPHGPEVAACLPGSGYTPGCDVDQNGVIDIVDVQRTATRWNSSGVYTSGHDHFGEQWTGATIGAGLHISNSYSAISSATLSTFTYGVRGVSDHLDGTGVWGVATATAGYTWGVFGRSDSRSGTGVYGVAAAASGATYGVHGRSSSTTGTGVYGEATAGSGGGVHGRGASVGVYGEAIAASGATYGMLGLSESTGGTGVYGGATAASGITYGVRGYSESMDGTGVYGEATAASGDAYGVHGRSDSTTGIGVYGEATAASGGAYGVRGESDSTSGAGVWGEATAASGGANGVRGESDSTSGAGVFGRANAASGGAYGVAGHSSSASGRGVFGWARATSGTTYGVYGRSDSADGYAGYFVGRLHATGTLSKGGGSFKIDHPLDPANQYLYHSFVESPDMMNVYNGNVTTNDGGFATVVLPDYFEALNRDFRYQLTVIGQFAQAIVAEEVQGNQFRIQTDQPGVKVSWQVTGIRQDAWANANRIPVEQDKPEGERGLYLHPEALGQPKDLGLDYQRDAQLEERPEVEAPPGP